MGEGKASFAKSFRTPRAAALSGIAFAVLLVAVLLLLGNAALGTQGTVSWYTDEPSRDTAGIGLALVPVVGIAFLWFIGVIRSLLGEQEDKLFATVFLGSGLLFVALLFVSAALTGGMIDLIDDGQPVSNDVILLVDATTAVIVGTLAVKMAAVFTLVVTNLGRRTGIVPRWLVVWGYATGLVLLLSPVRSFWIAVLFPLWVFTFSTRILLRSFRPTSESATDEGAAGSGGAAPSPGNLSPQE